MAAQRQLLCLVLFAALASVALGQMCTPAKLKRGNKKLESFEPDKKTHYMKIWSNKKSAELQWEIASGKTKSPMTGPTDGAFEGLHYLYMEASYPAKAGDEAVLEFKPFQGCVCLKFMCNLWVNKHSKLEVKANGKLYKTIRDGSVGSGRPWVQEAITINEPDITHLQLIGTRGDDFRGDIAIDNLIVTPGSCEGDFDIDMEDLFIDSRTMLVDNDNEGSAEFSGDQWRD